MICMSTTEGLDLIRKQRFDSLEQEAFLSLWRAYDRLRILEDEVFRPFDLTAQQYNALRLLRAAHPGSLATLDLAARLVSRSPDITRMLDKLQQRGLIDRDRQSVNRRVVRVSITEAGLALLDELRAPLKSCHEKQLGHLPRTKLKELIALLRSVRAPHEDESGRWQ